MKKLCLTISISVFLLSLLNGVQAQTMQTKFNQVELMKQFLGIWKGEIAKDTTIISDITPFGTAIEENYQIATNGKILDSGKQLWGYDKKNDKIIVAALMKSSPVIEIMAWWVTSENTWEAVPFKYISNPENASFQLKWEFKSPDLGIETTIQNSKVVAVYTFTREKK